MLKLIFCLKSPNAVHLRGNCQLQSGGFFMTKDPWLAFWLKHKISKPKFFFI